MRNALICLILLSGILTVSAQEADTAAVTLPDTVAVPAGKVIPMKGAFLTPLQERESRRERSSFFRSCLRSRITGLCTCRRGLSIH